MPAKTALLPPTPLLKWAGGKTWLIPQLTKIYDRHRDKTWIDPFCGGLALPLALQPERAILSDVNRWLINFYNCVRSHPEFKALDIDNTQTEFYRARVEFNTAIQRGFCDLEAMAGLFYYLNRTCFNGLCRFNSAGEFNTPYGNYKNPLIDRDFSPYRQLFKNWTFYYRDYFDFSHQMDLFLSEQDNSFLFLDPPYDDGFVGYSGNQFDWFSQVRLIETTDSFTCPIVICNKATERIVELYRSHGFAVEIVSAPRRIASNGNRQRVDEVLATKNLQ